MPLYEFIDGKGRVTEHIVPSGATELMINGQVLRRAPIPTSFGIAGFAKPSNQADSVKRDCYKAECSQTFKSKYSKQQLKRIWGI